ncbi:MAG: hypothetical protein IJJ26_05270 [Victivallales bacterium]|nr:hypothetical protein [Victivallales bacterium]
MPQERKKQDRLGVCMGWNNTRGRRAPRESVRRARWCLCVLGMVCAVLAISGLVFEFFW